MDESALRGCFGGRSALITGGLGFIGSTLAIRLAGLGARVALLDAMIPDHGGNLFNIDPVRHEAELLLGDIRDEAMLEQAVAGKDFVFHLAGQNDHVLSQNNPFPDIDINIKGSAMLLEACKRAAPGARLVYTGTRGEYGPAVSLPVSEDVPMNPKGIYELSSLTAQKLFQIYHDNHGLQTVTLRLTNIYGPRAQMRHHRFGVANWFVRLALDDATILVFGDGALVRDFLYVDDTVEAILACAACEAAYGTVFNVGHDRPSNFRELAETAVRTAGSGRWEFAPFSKERAALEPGDFCSDISKIRRIVGWAPRTGLEEGMERTVAFYRKHRPHYW